MATMERDGGPAAESMAVAEGSEIVPRFHATFTRVRRESHARGRSLPAWRPVAREEPPSTAAGHHHQIR